MSDHPVLSERAALCDLFDEVGPVAPTWCGEWTTTQLAAHLRTREHRLDAGPGLVLGGVFGRHTDRVQAKAATRGFAELVDELRSGPTIYWPGRWKPEFDVHEWFVHHEDVRRPHGLGPRDLGPLDDLVWASLARWGRQLTRSLDIGVRLRTPDGRERVAREGAGEVVLTAPPGELMLRLFGRDVAVEIDGDAPAVAAFTGASLGI